MELFSYREKVCVVTGASSRIGISLIQFLLSDGAIVYALDYKKIDLAGVHSIVCDFESKESISSAFLSIPNAIDCFFGLQKCMDTSFDYSSIFTIHFIVNKYITEEFLSKRMRDDSSICFLSSILGVYWDKYPSEFKDFIKASTWDDEMAVLNKYSSHYSNHFLAYPLSERALNYYAVDSSIWLQKDGIRVNTILSYFHSQNITSIVHSLLFLNSDAASSITGICLSVDNGKEASVKMGKVHDHLDMKLNSKLLNLEVVQKYYRKEFLLDSDYDFDQEIL